MSAPIGGCQRRKGPPFTPDQALETFRLPEGFRIELVASEPEVREPVAIAFDADGRLFVVEMSDYPMGGGTSRIPTATAASSGAGCSPRVSPFRRA
ncbi:MAG: hypothetical protein DMG07_25710 [Acidobacteria bacterium]|nr:MAG: hypothetical protein DMG07_25710 [Acidobacteriota bacterium]